MGQTRLPFALILLSLSSRMASACLDPKGIDFSTGDCELDDFCIPEEAFSGLPEDSVLEEALNAITTPLPGLVRGPETPIQNHWTASNYGQVYSAMAAFEPLALEVWGRKDVSDERRRCLGTVPQEHFLMHRRVTLAYTCLYVFSSVATWTQPAGGAEVPLRALAESWNIDFDLCDLNRRRGQDKVRNCNDISTPWGLAISLMTEIKDWLNRDGWNKNGNLSGAKNNRIPYRDWRPRETRYIPVNSPWTLTNRARWQPVMENDGQGFHFQQEHVVPHIGETAKSLFFQDHEFCQYTDELDNPRYDLDDESRRAIRRSALLDDRTKAVIEIFDNKQLSLVPLLSQFYKKRDVPSDSFEFITVTAANMHALREASILSWRAKIQFDLARPTTYIQNVLKNEKFEAYGGPRVAGPAMLAASDWQPYIRVMPHAEFPSASACLCRAFKEAVVHFTNENQFDNPLRLRQEAKSSRIEKDKPKKDEVFEYTSWTEIVHECSRSRLDGGMHFTASVGAGRQLCSRIGVRVASAFESLSKGDSPQYVIDFDFGRVSDLQEIRNCTVPENAVEVV